MALRFRLPRPSFAFFLQTAACAVVAWSLWNGGLTAPPTSGGTEPPATAGTPDSDTFNPFKDAAADIPFSLTSPAPEDPSTAAPAAAANPAPASAVGTPLRLAGAPGFEGAQLALSTIDVIVSRND